MVVGNSISFMVNGVQRIGVTDSSFTSGAPGIMAFDSATADNWSGGTASFQVSYQSTDAQGVKSYDVLSTNDGYGPQDSAGAGSDESRCRGCPQLPDRAPGPVRAAKHLR